jgi:hypothetical protein
MPAIVLCSPILSICIYAAATAPLVVAPFKMELKPIFGR